MTEKEWLDKARRSECALQQFVAMWHPRSHNPFKPKLPITAPHAEIACEQIRKDIIEEGTSPLLPLAELDLALKENNVSKIISLLNEAWFGVPESVDCWNLPGFPEVVDLMGDPIDEE